MKHKICAKSILYEESENVKAVPIHTTKQPLSLTLAVGKLLSCSSHEPKQQNATLHNILQSFNFMSH